MGNQQITERGGEVGKCPKEGANVGKMVEWHVKAPKINQYSYKLATENVSVPSICNHNQRGSLDVSGKVWLRK